MIEITRWYNNDCTIGRLKLGKFQCFTLELADRENQVNVSCIPDGVYEYFVRADSKNGTVIELKNVPDRTFIQIHSGNYTRQIKGCILVGDGIKYLDKDSIPDVSNSKKTLEKLLSLISTTGKIRIV